MADPNVGFARIRTDTLEYEVKGLKTGVDDKDAVNVAQLALVTAGLVSIIIEVTDDLEAVIEAASAGDHFYLRPGTHTVTAPVAVTAARVRVWGSPGSIVNFTGTGVLFDLGAGADNFHAEGFRVVLNSVNATAAFLVAAACNSVNVEDVWIDVTSCSAAAEVVETAGERTRIVNVDIVLGAGQTAAVGVRLDDGDDHRVEGVRIDGSAGTLTNGVYEDLTCNRTVIERVNVNDVSQRGIGVSGKHARVTTCIIRNAGVYSVELSITSEGSTIRGCHAHTCGPYYAQPPYAEVASCHSEDSPNDGILVGGGAHYTRIVDCAVISPADHGVNLGGANYLIVEGNTVYNAGKSGLYVNNCTSGAVEGNVAVTSAEQGIELAGTCTRCCVGGNSLVSSTGDSIRVTDASDYNVITSNQVPDGIDPGAATHNEVAHNVT